MCINACGFCLAGINAQLLSYYVDYFNTRADSPDKIFWAATSILSSFMFYFKMNSEYQINFQFGVLCAAALFSIASFHFIEFYPNFQLATNKVRDIRGNGLDEVVLSGSRNGF